jgi:hypothetical protein
MTQTTQSSSWLSRWMPSRVTAGMMLGLAVLVGILMGVAFDRSVLLRKKEGEKRGRFSGALFSHPSSPEAKRARARIARELDLTPVQQAQIDTIMTGYFPRFRDIRIDTETRIASVVGEMRVSIDSVLTPAQQLVAREMRARRDKARAADTVSNVSQ